MSPLTQGLLVAGVVAVYPIAVAVLVLLYNRPKRRIHVSR